MKRQLSPPAILSISFLFLIITGALLLKFSHSANPPLSWMEAFFTSTSAVCVTGLTIFDVGTRLTPFGQTVLLVLIQFGGLGLMSFSVATLYLLKGTSGILGREIISSSFTPDERLEVWALLKKVFAFTFIIEIFGAGVFF